MHFLWILVCIKKLMWHVWMHSKSSRIGMFPSSLNWQCRLDRNAYVLVWMWLERRGVNALKEWFKYQLNVIFHIVNLPLASYWQPGYVSGQKTHWSITVTVVYSNSPSPKSPVEFFHSTWSFSNGYAKDLTWDTLLTPRPFLLLHMDPRLSHHSNYFLKNSLPWAETIQVEVFTIVPSPFSSVTTINLFCPDYSFPDSPLHLLSKSVPVSDAT